MPLRNLGSNTASLSNAFVPSTAVVLPGNVQDQALKNLRLSRGTSPGRGAVVFSMDDGWAEMYTAGQALAARGLRATFCITTGYLDGTSKLTTAQMVALHGMGHEIGAHSVNHPNFATSTAAARQSQWDDPKATLEALIGEPVTSFAYPYGTGQSASPGRNATVDSEALGRYERLLDTNLYTNPAFHPAGSRPLLITRTPWASNQHQMVLDGIRRAAQEPLIFLVYWHQQDANQPYNPTTAQMLEAFDLCVSLGVPVLTAREAFGNSNLLTNPSFEDTTTLSDASGWRQFTSGANTAEVQTGITPDTGLYGSRCLRVSLADTGYGYVSQRHTVTPGTTYRLAFRARKNSGDLTTNHAYGRLQTYDYGQNPLGDFAYTAHIGDGVASTSWAKYSVDYTPPPDAKYISADLVVTGSPWQVDFDNCWLGDRREGDQG